MLFHVFKRGAAQLVGHFSPNSVRDEKILKENEQLEEIETIQKIEKFEKIKKNNCNKSICFQNIKHMKIPKNRISRF